MDGSSQHAAFVTAVDGLSKGKIHNLSALLAEEDRGCVLVGASQVEAQLTQLILAKFGAGFQDKTQIPKGLISKMLDPKHPNALLGSFWAKSSLLHVLGTIDEGQFRELDCLRKLRNNFAHSPAPVDLDQIAIDALVSTMITNGREVFLTYFSSDREWRAHPEFKGNYSVPRRRFMAACATIHMNLKKATICVTNWPTWPRTLKDLNEVQEQLMLRVKAGEPIGDL